MLMVLPVQGNCSTLLLDNAEPEAVISIEDAKQLRVRDGVKIADRTYRYITLKLADNLLYEGYITRCADDYAAKLNEKAQRQLNHCSEQVIGDLDHLMENTANLTFFSGGTYYFYRGNEGTTAYYYYSSVRVTHYYQTKEGRHPLYGLLYRCKQPVSDVSLAEPGAAQPSVEAERFIELAKMHCVNVLKRD